MSVQVRIPTILRNYTEGASEVTAEGEHAGRGARGPRGQPQRDQGAGARRRGRDPPVRQRLRRQRRRALPRGSGQRHPRGHPDQHHPRGRRRLTAIGCASPRVSGQPRVDDRVEGVAPVAAYAVGCAVDDRRSRAAGSGERPPRAARGRRITSWSPVTTSVGGLIAAAISRHGVPRTRRPSAGTSRRRRPSPAPTGRARSPATSGAPRGTARSRPAGRPRRTLRPVHALAGHRLLVAPRRLVQPGRVLEHHGPHQVRPAGRQRRGEPPPIECPSTSAGPMSSSSVSSAAYIVLDRVVGRQLLGGEPVGGAVPECVRRHDPVRRPQPVDQVGPALPRVGDAVQDEQDRSPGIAVLVDDQAPDTSLCCHGGQPATAPCGSSARTRGPLVQTGPMPRNIATTDRVGREELLEFVRPRHRRHARDHPQERPAAGLAGHLRRRRGGPGGDLDVPAAGEGRQPPARPVGDGADPQRRLGRALRPARRHRRGDRPARRRGAAGRLLPQHLR